MDVKVSFSLTAVHIIVLCVMCYIMHKTYFLTVGTTILYGRLGSLSGEVKFRPGKDLKIYHAL